VIVDANLNPEGTRYQIMFANQAIPTAPQPEQSTGTADIHEVDGGSATGPARVLPMTLRPMEIQILGNPLN